MAITRESYQDLAAPSLKNDILSSWRERIFFVIFLSVIVMALAPYIFSALRVIDEKRWGNLFIYTMGYLCIITIVWVRRIPFRLRVIIGLGTFYSLGLTALLSIGLLGSGRLWLFAFSIIASLLMGLRAGLITLLINAGTLFFMGYLLAQGQLEWVSGMLQPMKIWIVTSVTFLFLNTVITVSLSLLVRALERQLLQEQRMIQKLTTTNELLEQDREKRRQAEDELLLSEERLSLAINGAEMGMWDWNIEAEKATYSERWATMLGYELSELAPDFNTFKTLVHPEDKDSYVESQE
jgi:PAS domain-containing protein